MAGLLEVDVCNDSGISFEQLKESSTVAKFSKNSPMKMEIRANSLSCLQNNSQSLNKAVASSNPNLVHCNYLASRNENCLTNAPVDSSNGLKKVNNTALNLQRTVLLNTLPKRSAVDIAFSDVSYSVSEGLRKGFKTILKNVSGKFNSGELSAIMGPSGAGKSTLMNILAGFLVSNVSGDILVNGSERCLRRFRKSACYIMQEDCLVPHLTVLEAMKYAAYLKLGSRASGSEKNVIVREVLESLGLHECQNTRTSNLSGGQRKRLAIALELVNNPPVMFFDEPTSGLDSASCMQCIALLKALAYGGRTIVCTIHQPSARIFEQFDQLYMLADGQCIYKGVTSGLVPFLASAGLHCPSYHNPADFAMEVAIGEYGEVAHKLILAVDSGMCNKYTKILDENGTIESDEKDLKLPAEQSPSTTVKLNLLDSEEYIDYGGDTFPTSGWNQFVLLFHRSFICILRDQVLTRLRLSSYLLVGLLIGLLYFQIGNEGSKVLSNTGSLFFSQLFLMFNAMMPTLLTFPMELSVLKREHMNYWYSLKSYYLAKTLADLPFQIIFPMFYIIIVYFLSDQPQDTSRFFMFLGICVMLSLVSQSSGFAIGAAVKLEAAIFLGPITTIPLLLFSGFFVTLEDIPYYLQWVSYITYVRYGFEGSLLAIYGNDRPMLNCNESYCHYRAPVKILDQLGVKHGIWSVDIFALLGFFLLFQLIAFVALKWKLKAQR
ncbi:ATP-binding cassette subfamily G member 4-like isoform X1 [Artemia franciscana]|uniref:ATP-binding cassette subfamily G member 4-like isoform X1 n=1 Tax=Artemia franciscana TaxID=6661 RepID=UPI0032DAC0DC